LQSYRRKTSRGTLFTELRNHTDTKELQSIFGQSGFAYEGHLNYVIDLSGGEEKLKSRISKSVRKRARAAERKGVTVEELSCADELIIAYNLLKQIYARVQVPLADRSLFEAAYHVLAPKNMLKVFFARKDGQTIGVVFNLIYKNCIFGWYGGADREFSSYSPHELLEWHTILWGSQHQMATFDFGGAGRPDEEYGPRAFKSKFGGALVNYGRNVCVHAPQRLRLSQTGYKLARQFF
jgi:lipid II:glycine glycyltransferase (peptidoglycan interpeptide bridge formation enzyme)